MSRGSAPLVGGTHEGNGGGTLPVSGVEPVGLPSRSGGMTDQLKDAFIFEHYLTILTPLGALTLDLMLPSGRFSCRTVITPFGVG